MPTKAVLAFITAIDSATKVVMPYSYKLMYTLMLLDLTIFGIQIAMGKTASLEAIISKILAMGVIYYVVMNFPKLVFMFSNSVLKLCGKTTGFDSSFISDPSQILSYVHTNIIAPYMKAIDEFARQGQEKASGNPVAMLGAVISDFKFKIIYGVFSLVLLLGFGLIVIEVCISTIEFHAVLFFSMIVIPFIAFEPLAFIGKPAFNAVLGQSIKLGSCAFIVSIGILVFKNNLVNLPDNASDLNLSYIWTISIEVGLFAMLVLKLPTLAMSFLSGMPGLSLSGMISTASQVIKGAKEASGENNPGAKVNGNQQENQPTPQSSGNSGSSERGTAGEFSASSAAPSGGGGSSDMRFAGSGSTVPAASLPSSSNGKTLALPAPASNSYRLQSRMPENSKAIAL